MIKTNTVTRVWCDQCKTSYIEGSGYDKLIMVARHEGWIVGRKNHTCTDCQPPKYPGA